MTEATEFDNFIENAVRNHDMETVEGWAGLRDFAEKIDLIATENDQPQLGDGKWMVRGRATYELFNPDDETIGQILLFISASGRTDDGEYELHSLELGHSEA